MAQMRGTKEIPSQSISNGKDGIAVTLAHVVPLFVVVVLGVLQYYAGRGRLDLTGALVAFGRNTGDWLYLVLLWQLLAISSPRILTT